MLRALALAAIALTACVAPAQAQRVAFIGNSFVFYNDLPHLFESLVFAANLSEDLHLDEYLEGGQSLCDLSTKPEVSDLLLNRGPFDFVVIQDHSQGTLTPARRDQAIQCLSQFYQPVLSDVAGTAVLYQTWGYRMGIPTLGYPDFKSIVPVIIEGYEEYARILENPRLEVRTAPCGEAWNEIYDEEATPLDPSSLFSRLYVSDDYHPDLPGSYLNACVFLGTIMEESPRGNPYCPSPLTLDECARLQAVAHDIVFDRKTVRIS